MSSNKKAIDEKLSAKCLSPYPDFKYHLNVRQPNEDIV